MILADYAVELFAFSLDYVCEIGFAPPQGRDVDVVDESASIGMEGFCPNVDDLLVDALVRVIVACFIESHRMNRILV